MARQTRDEDERDRPEFLFLIGPEHRDDMDHANTSEALRAEFAEHDCPLPQDALIFVLEETSGWRIDAEGPVYAARAVSEGIAVYVDYEYDVFLSYKRNELISDWMAGMVRRLQFWLTNELGGRKTNLFFDANSIETGDEWPETIRDALRNSCCLVAVWSPEYFYSPWCVSEWDSFREREARIPRARLIAPMRFHDGRHFPKATQRVEMFDVREYANTAPIFWRTEAAADFDPKIRAFASQVAALIRRAPRFKCDWPVVETVPTERPNVSLPRL